MHFESQAFADAFSSACTTGGFGLAEQESFAQAIVQPLVEVYAIAFGGASCGGQHKSLYYGFDTPSTVSLKIVGRMLVSLMGKTLF